MSKIQELFDTMMADDNISKFKMKSRKDNLLFIKAKHTDGSSTTSVEAENTDGEDLFHFARLSLGKGRWELVRSLKSRGYTQQELASIFNTSQTAISYLLNNDYDPHP